MDKLLNTIKQLSKQARGFFPEKLPVGKSQFDAWVDSFIDTYSMPTSKREDVVFFLGNKIMHLGETTAYKSKFFFYLCIHAAAAKQVAGSAFYEIKHAQLEAQKAAQAKSVEVTTQPVVTADGPKQ